MNNIIYILIENLHINHSVIVGAVTKEGVAAKWKKSSDFISKNRDYVQLKLNDPEFINRIVKENK